MLAVFVPQLIQVGLGQSVTWDNPSTVGEPHTVTFVLDNKTATDIVSPFAVPNSTLDLDCAVPYLSSNVPFPVHGFKKVFHF